MDNRLIDSLKAVVNTLIKKWKLFIELEKQNELQAKLIYQATHDALTGLPNRYLLLDRLSTAIDFAKRKSLICGILFLDIDRFKIVNDLLGHEMGDKILKEFASRIIKVIRKSDLMSRAQLSASEIPEDVYTNGMIARMGGDEFVIVLNDLKEQSDCLVVYSRLRQLFEDPIIVDNSSFDISCSVGVSIYPDNGDNVIELLKNADIAMYRSKQFGGNQLQYYSKTMNEEVSKHYQLELELKKAIEHNELVLEYQPEVDLKTGNIVSVEALVRWQHPRLGLIYPAEFIPIAEEIGFINYIDLWVLENAAKQCKKWYEKGNIPYKIAVNVSSQGFQQADMIEKIKNIFEQGHLPSNWLEIEITESIVIDNYELVIEKIKTLRTLGIKFVIDDFGTGYSSLGYLSRIPIDKIKIDRSFISVLTEDIYKTKDNNRMIVEAIISIAQKMGILVLAEGIENEFQLTFLKERRCHEGQGFHLYKPMSAEKLMRIFLDYDQNK